MSSPRAWAIGPAQRRSGDDGDVDGEVVTGPDRPEESLGRTHLASGPHHRVRRPRRERRHRGRRHRALPRNGQIGEQVVGEGPAVDMPPGERHKLEPARSLCGKPAAARCGSQNPSASSCTVRFGISDAPAKRHIPSKSGRRGSGVTRRRMVARSPSWRRRARCLRSAVRRC